MHRTYLLTNSSFSFAQDGKDYQLYLPWLYLPWLYLPWQDGKDYQLYVETPEALHMWMSALPIYSGMAAYGSNDSKALDTLREEVGIYGDNK